MSISVQVLDISEYNEESTVANGYTLVYSNLEDDAGTSISLSSPYTLGTQTFTSFYIAVNGQIQFLNASYSTGNPNNSPAISNLVSNYGIAIVIADLYVASGEAIGYKYTNNNTQLIVNYNISRYGNATLKIQAKVTINLDNHPTSPRSIRIAYGLLQYDTGGVIGLAYGPASTVPTTSTMNYVVSDTPTNFVYPNVPVQVFTGTAHNYLTNKTIVYNIQNPNRPPVLSNNITISEIYGQTNYNVNLNNYTTDLDNSLTDVVYTLNPNGSSAMPNNTTLRFWMRDSYGDGWNGGKAVIRNSSNSVVDTLTGPSTNDRIWIYQDIVLSGVNTITWTTGSYADEPQLFITSPSYSWAASSGNPPTIGGGVYYRTIGITNRTDTLNFKTAKSLLGVSISGSILTLNSTLYNCDEFYITAKNTEKTYTSNTAKCSFTRLTDQQIAEAAATYNGSGELTSTIVTSLLNNKRKVVITGYSSIGANAFLNATSVTSITIPSSVTSIGANAFQGMTGLTSITIPSSVISIGSDAFLGSGITTVTFAVSTYFSIFGVTNTNSTQPFYGKSAVVVIALDTKVFSGIGSDPLNSATSQLAGATRVVIEGFTSIGDSAFSGASALTSITIPSSVTSIGASAFSSATALTSITIPSNVTSIGSSAFYGATSLTSVIFEAGSKLTTLGGSVFMAASKLTSITIPSGVTSIGNTTFSGATALTSITIPSNVTSIGNDAFSVTSSLTSVIFEAGSKLTSIGVTAFEGASALTSITIPSGVTSIGSATFYGTSALASIIFEVGSKLTRIESFAFQLASGLTSITIPSGVTNIGASAFQGASALTSIIIPSNVTSIGIYTFASATSLTSIIFEAGSKLTSIGVDTFQGATALTSITIPSDVTSIGATAFSSSSLTTAVFESASTVSTLGLPSGNLINGYIVSSFYGKASAVTFIYPEAIRAAIVAAPAAIISNTTFTSLLTDMNVNISNVTSEVIPLTNDPYVEYKAKLTIPEGVLEELSDIHKASIIETVKYLYAAQLGVNVDKVIVTLQSGSIIVIVNVLNDGITEAMVPICFPKGTPVTTNQGVIAIEKLNPDIHTIRGKKIVAITHSRPLHKYIISIEKDALGKNVPSAPIQISKEHKVFYKGKMVKANDLVEMCEGVTRIPYNGETLYNVLMEKHNNMMINNVICETLDPNNIMAKICGGKYNRLEQANICKELNDIIKSDNVPAYKKLYASLK
jgi:hypothetical protein